MKRIKSNVTYLVPSWNYCNSDNLVGGDITKEKCRFCVKDGNGYECLLHGASLTTQGEYIYKTNTCKRATCGDRATIVSEHVEPQRPAVQPKELMKQTIELYVSTMNGLLNDGYPRPLAENLAKQFILGGK